LALHENLLLPAVGNLMMVPLLGVAAELLSPWVAVELVMPVGEHCVHCVSPEERNGNSWSLELSHEERNGNSWSLELGNLLSVLEHSLQVQ